MRGTHLILGGILMIGLCVSQVLSPVVSARGENAIQALRPADYSSLRASLVKVKLPPMAQPAWLKQQLAVDAAAKSAARKKAANTITVSYDVMAKGVPESSLAEFRQLANQTLNDARGWTRMNVVFREVAGGGSFTLALSEASQVPSFSSGCSSEYSCRVGRYIIINQDRWNSATSTWNQAGGTLRDYRHMVINHEVGHWLGHGHPGCSGPGQPAPIMLQQSIELGGCTFNPWPLASELYSTQLGIN